MKIHLPGKLDEDEQKALEMLIQHERLLTEFVMPALAELLERVEAIEEHADKS